MIDSHTANEYLECLGMEARDRVTGVKGTATSVSFDVSGCVQVYIVQFFEDGQQPKDGTSPGSWYDHKRLAFGPARRAEVPLFANVPGGQMLPPPSSRTP